MPQDNITFPTYEINHEGNTGQWQHGQIITADSLNKMQEQIKKNTQGFSNIIQYNSTQPDGEYNQVWVSQANNVNTIATLAQINDVESNISSVFNAIANEYNNTKSYNVGEYVQYDKKIYKCINNVYNSRQSWQQVQNNFQQVSIANNIEELQNNIEQGISTLTDNFALQYDNNSTYNQGQYIMHEGILYKCQNPVTTAGNWDDNSNNFIPVTVGNEVNKIDNMLITNYTILPNVIKWEINGIDGTGKKSTNAPKRIRTVNPGNVFNGIVKATDGVTFIVYYYSSTTINATNCVGSSGSYSNFVDLNSAPSTGRYFMITAQKNETTLTDVVDATGAKITLYASNVEINKIDVDGTTDINLTDLFEIGSISSENGNNSSGSGRCRTISYITLRLGDVLSIAEGYKLAVYQYLKNGNTYTFDVVIHSLSYANYTVTKSGYYRLVLAKSDDSDIDNISAVVSALTVSTPLVKIKTSNVTDFEEAVYNKFCISNVLDNLELGSLDSITGDHASSNGRKRSADYWLTAPTRIIWGSTSVHYKIFYYSRYFEFLYCTPDWSTENGLITATNYPGAMYYRILVRRPNDVSMKNFTMPSTCKIMSSYPLSVEYLRDKPKNDGVFNVIYRALQCTSIEFTTTNAYPRNGSLSDISSGTEVQGLQYSSTREEKLWVPNCVSFDSYMTAIMSPNSYIYTRRVTNYNGKAYMGTVCSTFVSYCLDLPAIYTTSQIESMDTMIPVVPQSPYAIELGDVMRQPGHIVIITDILRDGYGRMKKVQISEAVRQGVRSLYKTPAEIQSMLTKDNYTIYRYTDIAKVTYTPTPWVAVGYEKPSIPIYNTNMCPRRGDKSNWPVGETVEIDVLNVENYTHAKLYKDDTLIDTSTINAVLSYANLEYGTYKVCLTNGVDDSDFVYFIVVDTSVRIENDEDTTGKAKVIFSSHNATPVWLDWCHSVEGSEDYMASVHAVPITDAERTNGYAETTYQSGTYLFDVQFKTDFGVISSQLVSALIT